MNDNDLTDYQKLQRWNKGERPPAQGRRWQRGDPPKPRARSHRLHLGDSVNPAIFLGGLPPLEQRDVTGTVYVLHQIFPADGWEAEYQDGDGSTFTAPVYFLALAQMTEANGTSYPGIVGIDYHADDQGWNLIAGYNNFLQLIPPE